MAHVVPVAGVNFHDKAQALKPVAILRRETDSVELDSNAQALKSHVLGLSAAVDALEVEIVQSPNTSTSETTRTNGSNDASSSNFTPGSNRTGIPMDAANVSNTTVSTDNTDTVPAATPAPSGGGGGSGSDRTDTSVTQRNGRLENERTHEVIDRSIASNSTTSDKMSTQGSHQNDSWNATTDTRTEKDRTEPDPLDPDNTTR